TQVQALLAERDRGGAGQRPVLQHFGLREGPDLGLTRPAPRRPPRLLPHSPTCQPLLESHWSTPSQRVMKFDEPTWNHSTLSFFAGVFTLRDAVRHETEVLRLGCGIVSAAELEQFAFVCGVAVYVAKTRRTVQRYNCSQSTLATNGRWHTTLSSSFPS